MTSMAVFDEIGKVIAQSIKYVIVSGWKGIIIYVLE